jgi:hypothetical protein
LECLRAYASRPSVWPSSNEQFRDWATARPRRGDRRQTRSAGCSRRETRTHTAGRLAASRPVSSVSSRKAVPARGSSAFGRPPGIAQRPRSLATSSNRPFLMHTTVARCFMIVPGKSSRAPHGPCRDHAVPMRLPRE